MSLTGNVTTLFADKEKTQPILPRTKVKAISDDNGVGLDAILDGINAEISNVNIELDNAIDRLSEVGIEYQAIIGTTWTGSTAPYTQEITVAGLLEDDNPMTDVVVSDDYTTSQLQLDEFAKIYKFKTAEDKIIAYAKEKTTVSLPIQLVVARDKVIETGGTSSDSGASVIVDSVQPENPKIGDMWYDSGDTSVAYIDELPTEGSTNFVTSGGVFEALSGKISIVKLWENASPSSAFTAQNIAVDLNEYDFVLVDMTLGVQYPTRKNSFIIPKGSLGYGMFTVTLMYFRYVSLGATSINFGHGVKIATYGTQTEDNNWVIPVAVYGIKGVK